MQVRLIDVLAAISTVCAVAATGVVLSRNSSGQQIVAAGSAHPVLLDDWRSLAAVGHRFGDTASPVTLIEFSDFECPYCATFARHQLPAIREQYAGKVQVVFRHWPLPMHRFAYPAARASECAATQGRFWEYHDALFEAQDSLGLLSFDELAFRAGVQDIQSFHDCNAAPGAVASIDADMSVAQAIGGTGTPTIVVNGWRFKGAPSMEVLDSIVAASIKAGGSQ